MLTFKEFLFEMALSRSTALKKIEEQGISFSNHIMSILIFKQYSDWDQTVFDISMNIERLVNSSKTKLDFKTVYHALFYRYIEGVDLEVISKILIKQKGLKKVGSVTHDDLKEIYTTLITGILNGTIDSRQDIRNIIKI